MAEYAGLGSAALWAVTSVVARAQSRAIDAVTLNLTRMAAASLFFIVGVVVSGRLGEVLHLPLDVLALLIGAVIVSMALGDTIFFASMARIGTSRAMPISGVFPLFAVLLAAPLAGEPLTPRLLAGAGLVVVGVGLVATGGTAVPPGAAAVPRGTLLRGIALALLAAFTWGLGTVLLKLGAVDVDVFVANTVRLPAATATLLLYRQLVLARRTPLPRPAPRQLLGIALAGLIGSGVGGALYVLSAQVAGAGRTATMGATAPLWAAPLAAVFLKEPIGARVILGTVLSVVGLWLLF